MLVLRGSVCFVTVTSDNFMNRNIAVLLVVLLLSGCAKEMNPPLSVTFLPERGEFINDQGERVSFHQALALAAKADYVVLGEGHKNSCDHSVQQRIVRGLVQAGKAPAIGLEMVAVDMQPVLDRFGAGEIKLGELEKELDWSVNWGYPFALFEPLFEQAHRFGLPLGALNVPKRVTRKFSKEGEQSLTEEDRLYFPSSIIGHLPAQEEMLRASFALHEDIDKFETQIKEFMLVQSIWDSMMAQQAVRLGKDTGRPVVVIAGSGHVDFDWGISRRIRLLDPGAKVTTLVPVRDIYQFDKDMGTLAFYCPQSYEGRLGMTLELRQGRVVVVAVKPGTRAALAGLRPGDELIRAQGILVSALADLHHAGRLAHNTNKPLKFVLKRHGQRVSVNLGKLGLEREDNKEKK